MKKKNIYNDKIKKSRSKRRAPVRRLAKEECGSETDRPDIRGGPICYDIALITPTTHLLDLYTIYGMKYIQYTK